jgi:hypothetical protein
MLEEHHFIEWRPVSQLRGSASLVRGKRGSSTFSKGQLSWDEVGCVQPYAMDSP